MTKKNLEAYKKASTESYTLQAVSALELSSPYFLRNYPTNGFANQLDYQWVKKGKVKASITLAIAKNGEAVSLPQSPFGGIWLSESISTEALEQFILAVMENLRHQGIQSLKIIQPPRPYEAHHDLIQYLLFRLGFVQTGVLSHQFFIGKKKIKRFLQKENQKLGARIKEIGLKIQVSPIQNFGFLQEIRNWNSTRGYQINFEEDRLIQQVSSFPERYFLIGIFYQKQAIAYALAVKLTPDSLYYYLSASDPKSTHRNLGEIILLQLFQLAVDQKVNFIDLGSSDGESSPNHSLMFFKSRFTNDISNKVIWTMNL